MTKVRIPFQALSVNKAWQGRKFKTPLYVDFEKRCLLFLPRKEMVKGWVRVSYVFGMDTTKSFKLSDIGNFEKPLSDILVKRGYIEDDRFIVETTLRKEMSEEGNYIRIEIDALVYNPLQ